MRIIEACIYVSDVDVAEEFYSKLLETKPYAKAKARHVFFKLENAMLLIFNPEYTKGSSEVPPHGCYGQGHIAFAIGEGEIENLKRKLNELGIKIEAEIEWKGGGKSIYIRDPFGNSVEFTTPKTWGYDWREYTG
jgi:Lactoylglutathione lyase and related lyases